MSHYTRPPPVKSKSFCNFRKRPIYPWKRLIKLIGHSPRKTKVANQGYTTITCEKQGLTSAKCSAQNSIGNKCLTAHLNEIQVLAFVHDMFSSGTVDTLPTVP